MKKFTETQLRFGMLVVFVILAFVLIGTYAQAQSSDPALPDDITYTLNGDNPTYAGYNITSGTAGGQIYRGDGATYVPWGTTCLPGYTATTYTTAGFTGITFCVSPGSVSPAIDYVIGGNWSTYSGAVFNDTASSPATDLVSNQEQCLGCHTHQGNSGLGIASYYLLTGHKNALRKIVAGSTVQQWAGPDGNLYNTSDAFYGSGSTYNWTAGTVTLGLCTPAQLSAELPAVGLSGLIDSGCSYTGYGSTNNTLYYLLGGWLYYGGNSSTGNPHLNAVFNGGFIGEQYPDGNFDCGRCHATGYNFVATGTAATGTADTGASTYPGPEPTIQTSTTGTGSYTAITNAEMSRWPTDSTSGSSSWYLTGVQCERCHIAEASYLDGPGAYAGAVLSHRGNAVAGYSQGFFSDGLVIPADLMTNAICLQCHREETITTGATPTIQPTYPPVAQDTGFCSDGSLNPPSTCSAGWIYRPVISHAAGTTVLNSPHMEFNSTLTQNAQNSADLSLGSSVTTASNYLATVPTPEGAYFIETTGTDAGQNLGCTGCHDPHFTTVVTPAQYNANPALYHTLQGTAQHNCGSCHGDIVTNILSTIKHPTGYGTPFPTGTDADVPGACVICHMQAASPNPDNPTQGVPQNHFFRVNPSPTYYTYPTGTGNYGQSSIPLGTATDPNTNFAGAIWNDVDTTCGQCHAGGNGTGTNPYGITLPNPAPPVFSRTYLASAANGIHGTGGTSPTTVSAPSFSPAATTSTSALTVTISTTTSSATLCYTTNGITVPTAGVAGKCDSNGGTEFTYTAPLLVSSTETLQAIGTFAGDLNSAVTSGAYSVNSLAQPTFSPGAGSYAGAQTVTITSTGNNICYAFETAPLVSGGSCSGTSITSGSSVVVSSTETLYAIAYGASSNSATGTAAYIIATLSAPTFSPAATTYTSATTVTITSTLLSGDAGPVTICYNAVPLGTASPTVPTASTAGTCDGSDKGGGTSPFTVVLSGSETLSAIATQVGYTNSYAANAAYTYGGPAASTPTFSPAATTSTSALTVTISTTTPSATLCYTTNGSEPTADTSPGTGTCDAGESSGAAPVTVIVSTTEEVRAIAVKTGNSTSGVGSAQYTIGTAGTVATPTFSPAAGTYAATQTTTISDTTSGAVICYTTNGSTPTAATAGKCDSNGGTEFTYSAPFAVSSTETVLAIGTLANYTNSLSAGVHYAITPSPPTFSLAASTYTSPQTLTISDSNAGATICYTITNGSTGTLPTANESPGTCDPADANGGNSTAGPVTVILNVTQKTTETIEAIATLAAADSSSTATIATYTINPATAAAAPTFSPVGGTYTSTQTVTISDTTAGAVICYSIGAVPTATVPGTCDLTDANGGNSTPGSVTVPVSSTETLEAIATVLSGYTNSPVVAATYTINTPQLAAPVLSPAAGTYTTAQTVTMTAATGATICYAVNGTPTTSSAGVCATGSTTYSAGSPPVVSVTETLEALATEAGFTNSPVVGGTYTIAPVLSVPTFSPAPSTYTSAQTVTLSATAGATICYAINATPTTSTAGTCATGSTTYSVPFAVSTTEAVYALATESGYTNSNVGGGTYTIGPPQLSAPTFSPVGSTYTSPQTVTLSATSGATICYTTDGKAPTASVAGTCDSNAFTEFTYTTPLVVSSTETLMTIATEKNYANSSVASATYTINLPQLAAPTFSPAAGSYTGTQTVTISAATGATICYTTNGSAPTASTAGTCDSNGGVEFKYTTALSVSSSETVEALATEIGYVNSSVASATYTITLPVAAKPTFSEAAGTYYQPQTVTLSDTTSGVTICYTTAVLPATPSTPVVGSSGTCTVGTVYSITLTPIPLISVPTTVDAVAGGTGFTSSGVVSKTYTIKALAPSFSPGAGTYTGAQTVTITDSASSPGATIYWAFNAPPTSGGIGTTTTACSSPCSVPVPGTETLEAVSAFDSGLLSESSVKSAVYTIEAAAPTFSPGPGTYHAVQTVTLADATQGVTICYTTAVPPAIPATPVVTLAGGCTVGTPYSPITVSTTTTIEAVAGGAGYSASSVKSGTYTLTAVKPTFSPGAGTYKTAQTVTLSDATVATPPVTICYTVTAGTAGTTPVLGALNGTCATGTPYTTGITVSTTSTIEAVAGLSGFGASSVASATYTIP